MTAGNEQQQIGKSQAIGETRRQGVAFQMVDGIKRLLRSHGQRLGSHQSDDQPADQSRSCRGCHCMDIGKLHASIVQRPFHQPVQRFHVSAGGNLRHHAAIGLVLGDLAQNHVGQNPSFAPIAAFDDCGGCFVATCFYSKNAHLRLDPACLIIH